MESVRAETASLDQTVMLPKLDAPPSPSPAVAPALVTPPVPVAAKAPALIEGETKPKPARKRAASTKPKSGSPRRGKKPAEPPHE